MVASFSNSATAGNYSFSITGGVGTNGQPVLFNPLPVTGATVTIVLATPTPTSTIGFTLTATPTASPKGNNGVAVYPNPATGPAVSVLPPAYSGVSDVQVEIFTLAFRMVQDETFHSVPSGMPVTVELTDKSGAPLANGLYYIVVTVDGHRSVGKLLLIR